MSTQIRKYELKARAESQRETRERIARAAAELHEEIGVARTTVVRDRTARRRAAADGLQPLRRPERFASRLLRPLRRPAPASRPRPRTSRSRIRRRGFAPCSPTSYGWYRETEPMLDKLHGDRSSVPALDQFMRANGDRAWPSSPTRWRRGSAARGPRAERLRALVALALDFGELAAPEPRGPGRPRRCRADEQRDRRAIGPVVVGLKGSARRPARPPAGRRRSAPRSPPRRAGRRRPGSPGRRRSGRPARAGGCPGAGRGRSAPGPQAGM